MLCMIGIMLIVDSMGFLPSSRSFLRNPARFQTSSEGDAHEKVEQQGAIKFPDAEFFTFSIADHVPLGCTVEETLDPASDHVFISKITEGSFAEEAGLKVGDVIIGVTGMFGGVANVMDSGVDHM